MASAPGARAVVPDEPLTPTRHRSVPAAFAGDPHQFWAQGIDGSSGTVAVLDTGIDGRHPDVGFGTRLETNVRVVFSHNELLGPYEPVCEPDRYSDEFFDQMENTETVSGHGTFMASVVAGDGTASEGVSTGMAPGADVIGVGVIDTVGGAVNAAPGCASRGYMSYEENDSCEARLSTLGAIAGIEFVLSRFLEVPRPVKVILAAWTLDGLYDPWHPLAYAAAMPSYYGVAFVTASGNKGPAPSDCTDVSTCSVNPLAAAPRVVSVAAGTRHPRPVLDEYSSRGDPEEHVYEEGTFRYEPTIVAPGANVVAARATVATTPLTGSVGPWGMAGRGKAVSADPDYVSMTGTSIAAAHVAGAIMLMQDAAVRAKGCFLTVEQVHEVLEASATPMDDARWNVGAGMIDASLAITLAEVWPKKSFRETYLCPGP
jgi:subtilisin family serine protease